MKNLVAFGTGVLFACGLGLGGMTQPHIVKGFLDVFGEWNLMLLGVMMGAIGVHAIAYQAIMKRKSPLLNSTFFIPTRKDIDKKLILGAALFGLGWGWAGICPGPGLVGLASGQVEFFIFILAMLSGMGIYKLTEKK